MRRRRKARTVVTGGLLAAVAALCSLGASAPASMAATTAGYPTAQLEFGTSTRTQPYIRSDTYWGYALGDWSGASRQTVSVMCWYDGDSANWTRRWFRVLVWESYDGYSTPRWLFVNGSYLHNWPTVRICNRTSTGFW